MDKYKIDEEIYKVENYHENEKAFFKTFDRCVISERIKRGVLWEPFLHKVFEQYVNSDSIVVDAGTHIGTHTIKLAKIAKTVYAFEALNPTYNLLLENIKLNHCNNVIPYENALSDKEEDLRFKWERKNNLGASALVGTDMVFVKPSDNDIASNRVIHAITLDSLKLDKLDFFKLDIEGYETKAIDGAVNTIKKCRPIITVECYSPTGRTPSEAFLKTKFKTLIKLGYRFEKLDNHTDFIFLPS